MKSPLLPIAVALLLGIIAASILPPQSIPLNIFFIFTLVALILYILFRKKKTISAIFLYVLIFLTGVVRFVDFNALPRDSVKFIAQDKPMIVIKLSKKCNNQPLSCPRKRASRRALDSHFRGNDKNYGFFDDLVIFRGTILTNPVFKRKYGCYPELEFVLDLHAVKYDTWKTSSGKILVKAYYGGEETFRYGDKVVLKGKLSVPREANDKDEFNYKTYLEAKRIYGVLKVKHTINIKKVGRKFSPLTSLKRFLYSTKEKARDLMLINLAPPHSSIMAAMLLGEKQFIDRSTEHVFIKTGTLHILAISGLHVGIIVFIFLGFFKLIGIQRKAACALTILIILLYALMIGQRPSAWRAAIMASLFLSAFILNRQPNLINVFSFALALLVLINPNYIFDIGFILSFTCLASIIWITPIMDRLLIAKKQKRPFFYILKSFSVSISVWVGILPIIAYYFHMVTPITIIANLAAVPLCFVLVSLGITSIFLNLIFPALSVIFYEAIWFVDKSMILILKFLSEIPFASIQVKNFPVMFIFIYYAILIVILHSGVNKQG